MSPQPFTKSAASAPRTGLRAPGMRPSLPNVRLSSGSRLRSKQVTMTEPRRPDHSSQTPGREGPRIDEELLARAAEINEAVAGEFAKKAVSPLDNPVIGRMAELGVETDAAVSVALQRAHRIAFYMRRGRTPRDAAELSADARTLSEAERARVPALAVSWWDGVLTALRPRELEGRGREP